MAGVTAFLVLILVAVPAYATDYTVGDSQGWTTGVDYSTWTSDKTFKVGDNLVFQYGGFHSVYEVGQSDYNSCTTSNSINNYNDGNTKIPFTAAGTRYFVCGAFGHCGQGMKLAVTVAATSPSTPSTPSTPATPSTPSTPSTPTTPSSSGGSSPSTPSTPSNEPSSPTTPSPSDNKSEAAGIHGGQALMIGGLLLGFGLIG